MSAEQSESGNEVLKKLLANSDLFGTGNESDSESERESQEAVSQQKHSPRSWSEEGEDEESLTPPPGVETKKRNENARKAKPKKAKKAEVQVMFSESQKLVRESSINLPKYQSKAKTIDSFLTKLRYRKSVGTPVTLTPSSAVARLKCGVVSTPAQATLNDKENEQPIGSQLENVLPALDGSNAECLDSNIGSQEQPLTTNEGESQTLISEENSPVQQGEEKKTESESDVSNVDKNILEESENNITTITEIVEEKVETDQLAMASPPGRADELSHGGVGGEGETGSSSTEDQRQIIQSETAREQVGGDKDGTISLGGEKKLKPSLPGGGDTTKRKQRHQRTLLTLFASNAAANGKMQEDQQKSHERVAKSSSIAPSPQLSSTAPAGPALSSMDDFLLENDAKLTVDVPVIPAKPLTPMEKFQQRLMKHMTTSSQPVRKEKRPSTETNADVSGDKEGSTLIPEEIMAKLKDKPGAVREHLRSALRQKLSKSRAEERKAIEEKKKLYNEEMGGETDEEEAELTDGETSDEEYMQDQEAANADSDVCSDLDDDEAEKAELQTDKPTNENPADNGDINSDEDIEPTTRHASQTHKRSATARRVLDSDDDEDMDTSESGLANKDSTETPCKAESSSERLHLSSALSDNTMHSASLFDDTKDGSEATANPGTGRENLKIIKPKKNRGLRRPSVMADLEEASMPPLILNDSIGSDSGSSFTDEEGEVKVQAESSPGMDAKRHREEDKLPSTQPMMEEDGGVGDNSSLELSLLWQPSMPPPAQVRKDSSEDLILGNKKSSLTQSNTIFDVDSQWFVRGDGDNYPIKEDVDEETQLLDANGLLYVRKERQPRHSPLSAIKDSVDPTQEGSPTELLALCSGQFAQDEDAQLVGDTAVTTNGREQFFDRSLSDSSTQGVRELLGLTAEPVSNGSKPIDSIARLFSSFESESQPLVSKDAGFGSQVNSLSCTQQIDEVIGLCSGVFPTTQTQLHQKDTQQQKANVSSFKFSSQVSNAGTSDGMSNESSDEEEAERGGEERGTKKRKMSGDQALLRWAKRQRELEKRAGASGWEGESDSEDEDMPLLKRRRIRVKQKPSKQDRLAEFVESEAELSGSDVGSDKDEEDFLYAEEDYEEDEGAGSDLPLSDSELKDQINKVHMKHTLADDKANLRDLQERFLKEGDLYEDGLAMKNGFFRTRHFNRNGSEAGSLDLFGDDHHSDGEGATGLDGGEHVEFSSQAEAKRRKDRLEREEFIRKFREKEGSLMEMDEDSQSILDIIKDNTSHSLLNTPSLSQSDAVGHMRSRFSGVKRARGSFLKQMPSLRRTSSSLVTPNSVTSTATPTPVGVSTGRGFVFQKGVARPSTGSDQVDKQSSKSRKVTPSNSKKPKLDRSISVPLPTDQDNSNSIFSILKY